MKLFVYHTPELAPADVVPDCAIAVDVLRATTTIAAALASGAEAVQAFSDLEQLIQVSEAWPAEQRIRIGERGGKTVDGFDMGNSPLDCTPERVKGCRIFMSTTNGTRALQRVQAASVVFAAALTNRRAIVQFLQAHQPDVVWVVGSGWEGSFSLEDTVCAGAIADSLWTSGQDELAGNDETLAAIALYRQYQNNLLGLLHQASHGKRLLKLGNHVDLKYCAQTDILDILPTQKEAGILVSQAN